MLTKRIYIRRNVSIMSIRIALLTLLFFNVLSGYAYAMTPADSLLNLISEHKQPDTVRVNLLVKYAELKMKVDAMSVGDFVNEAYAISDGLGYTLGVAESKRLRGVMLITSDRVAAKVQFEEALNLYRIANNRLGEAKTLNLLGVVYKYLGEEKKSYDKYSEALAIALNINNQSLVSKCLVNVALYEKTIGMYDEALNHYLEAVEILKKINDNLILAKCYTNIGTLFSSQGNYPKALEYYQLAVGISEQIGDKMNMVNSYINLSNIYNEQKRYEEALTLLNKALTVANSIDEPSKVSGILLNIANVYRNTDKTRALEYYSQALSNLDVHDDITIRFHLLASMGEVWQSSGNHQKALELLNEAHQIASKTGTKDALCKVLYDKAAAYKNLQKYNEAQKLGVEANNLALKHNLLVDQRNIALLLSEIYKEKGNFDNAIEYYKSYVRLDDSISNSANVRKMAELEYQYKYDKEMKAVELEQQKRELIIATDKRHNLIIIISLSVGLFIVLLFAALMLRFYIKKRRANMLIALQSEEINAANIALTEINVTKDKFFSIIAHDLRGAFNSILGFSDLLRNDVNGSHDSGQADLSLLIRESAENAYKLLNNLLSWSIANVGLMPFKPVPIEFRHFVESNKIGWSSHASNKNIAIDYNIPDGFKMVADADMLSTIMRNLVNNSVKYTPRGGCITIGASETPGGSLLSVSDNGVGMDADVSVNLFKINKKMSMPGTEKEQGSGLGLLICKEFASKHNGSIWAISEPGKGSCFNVYIPEINVN